MSNFVEVKIMIPTKIDSETAKAELGNAVYRASVYFYETIGEYGHLTDGKKLIGNGHHMAQLVSAYAENLFQTRLIEKEDGDIKA